MAIYDRERYKVVLPQLESRLKSLEEGVSVKCSTVLSEPFSVTNYTGVSAPLKKIRGYTPHVVGAYTSTSSGSGFSYCFCYSPRIDGDRVRCNVRNAMGTPATDIKVMFKIIYIADKNLMAMKATPTSSGGGGGTTNYEDLINKPSIEGVTLVGNKTFEDLTLVGLTNIELYNIVNGTELGV